MEWCITHLSQLIKFMELWAVTCLVGSRNQLDPTAFHTSNFSVESVRFDDCSHIYRFVGSNGMQIETMPVKISSILIIEYHRCFTKNQKSDPRQNRKPGIQWNCVGSVWSGRIRWKLISNSTIWIMLLQMIFVFSVMRQLSIFRYYIKLYFSNYLYRLFTLCISFSWTFKCTRKYTLFNMSSYCSSFCLRCM